VKTHISIWGIRLSGEGVFLIPFTHVVCLLSMENSKLIGNLSLLLTPEMFPFIVEL